MGNRWLRIVVLMGLPAWQVAQSAWGDEGFYGPANTAPNRTEQYPPDAVRPDVPQPDLRAVAPQAGRDTSGESEWSVPSLQPPPLLGESAPLHEEPRWNPRPPQGEYAGPQEPPQRFPGPDRPLADGRPLSVNNAGPIPQADPRWSDANRPPVNNAYPQEAERYDPAYRSSQSGGREQANADNGKVHGRLLNKRHPVVNCCVVMVPMREESGTISADHDRKPVSTRTDDTGGYVFENVSPGAYKLTWLPQGTNQWIRRLSMQPDVHVHRGETVELKDIRVALQTIN